MFPCFFCNNSKNFTVMRLVMFCFLSSVMALFVTIDWLIVRETPIGLLSKLISIFFHEATKDSWQPFLWNTLRPFVCLSVCPEFFSFLEFSDFLYEGSTSSKIWRVTESDFWKNSCSGVYESKGPKLRFLKFYEKLTLGLFWFLHERNAPANILYWYKYT